MKIRKFEENKKKIDEINRQIKFNNDLINKIFVDIKNNSDESKESIDELVTKLSDAKVTIKLLNNDVNLIKSEIPNTICVSFSREMIGNEVAKLMSEIMDRNYIYMEDYQYKIDDGSDNRWEFKHINILKNRIYIIIDEKYINHEPFIECYDKEFLDLSKDCYKYWTHKRGYINTYKDMLNNKSMFILPVPHLLDCDNEQIEYIKKDHMKYQIGFHNDNSFIYGLYERNKIVEDFLSIIILKSFYTGRSLSEEEIEKIRIKFIELYKSGYEFEYYEDDLYNIDEKNKQKVINLNNN